MNRLGLLSAAYAIWWALGKRRHHYEIWGDGAHDDQPGIQRLIDTTGRITLVGGFHRLAKPVSLARADYAYIVGCTFTR